MGSSANIALDPQVDTLSIVIDEQDFERALDDPAVRDLHREADEFLAELERRDRDF